MASSSKTSSIYKCTNDRLSQNNCKSSTTLDDILTDVVFRMDSDYDLKEGNQSLFSIPPKMDNAIQQSCCESECIIGNVDQKSFQSECKMDKGIQCPILSKSSLKKKGAQQKAWAEYIDKKVIHSGCVDEAALCTLDGMLMAKVGMEGLTQEAVKGIVRYLRRPQDSFRTGFNVCGRKYMYLSGSTNNLRGRDINDKMGIIVTKGKHTVFIGLSRNLPYLGECDYVMDKQTAFLEMVGY